MEALAEVDIVAVKFETRKSKLFFFFFFSFFLLLDKQILNQKIMCLEYFAKSETG